MDRKGRRMEKAGRFPKSTYIWPNRRVWFEGEIIAWQNAVDESEPWPGQRRSSPCFAACKPIQRANVRFLRPCRHTVRPDRCPQVTRSGLNGVGQGELVCRASGCHNRARTMSVIPTARGNSQ